MKITKKLSIFITIFVLIFGVQFVQPKKANAQITDIPAFLKEYAIDTLVTILQNRILNKLVDDAVNWANGGFDGDPGFINNWDDFLQGVTHDALSTALYTATKQANKAQGEATALSDEEKKDCLITANDEYQENLDIAEKRKNYYFYINNECSGLDGDEYNDCEDEAEIEIIPYHFGQINTAKTAKEIEDLFTSVKDFCNGIGDGGGIDWERIAKENYHSYMNTGVIDARSAATTVASYGAKKLNLKPLDSLISGEGKTITFLLGSQENVDNFKTDFQVGGWQGYMALADPHNYTAGVNAMLEKTLRIQTASTSSVVDKAVDDLQTPQKYFDKRKCIEWSDPVGFDSQGTEDEGDDTVNTSVVGSGSKVCIKYETVTPGGLVETKMKKAMTKDEDQSYLARELSDVLASALGRLTEGLLQVGISKLQDKYGKKTGDGDNANIMNDIFASTYQNAYDVLGIADDARIFNTGDTNGDGVINEEDFGDAYSSDYETNTGKDASIPYVGGPEDLVGLSWSEGPELIVELKNNLEKSLRLNKEYINLSLGIEKSLKLSRDNVAILDYCRPGPDIEWEKKYNDKARFIMDQFKSSKDDDEDCGDFKFEMNEELFEIGLPIIREMNNDPNINIPGASEMTSIINSVMGEKNKELAKINKENKEGKRSMYNILLRIELELENEEFTEAKDYIDDRIVLFNEKIYNEETSENENGDPIITRTNILTNNDLIEILGIKVVLVEETGELIGLNNGENRIKAYAESNGAIVSEAQPLAFDEKTMIEEYLIEYRTLYVFKEIEQEQELEENEIKTKIEETPEYIVLNKRPDAEKLIIDLGWDIWRNNVNKELKSKLRYQYHTFKNVLVTEKDVLELEIELKNTSASSSLLAKYVLDCSAFLLTVNGKTDSEIKSILEEEYSKQKNNEDSKFITGLYTSPANIETSILKFVDNGEETIDEYFSTMYGSVVDAIESETSETNALGKSIAQILELDKTVRTVRDNMTDTIFEENNVSLGVFTSFFLGDPTALLFGLFDEEGFNPNEGKELFCHTKGLIDQHRCVSGTQDYFICESKDGTIDVEEGNDNNEKWKAAQRWYFGKKITYRAAFAGI